MIKEVEKQEKQVEDDKPLRFDFVFSYWIFIWYILYQMNIINANPKLILIIASLYIISVMLFYKHPNKCQNILPFSIATTIIKLIPLYTLRNTMITKSDIEFTLLFIFIYLAWLDMNHGIKEVFDFYTFSLPGVIPPFEYHFNKIIAKYNNCS